MGFDPYLFEALGYNHTGPIKYHLFAIVVPVKIRFNVT